MEVTVPAVVTLKMVKENLVRCPGGSDREF
jgi:hypothetical protein